MASTFISPNSITIYLKYLQRVLNAIFYSSPSTILIRWYPSLRSSAIKILVFPSRSLSSLILGSGYRSLIVISFSYLQSTYSQSVPSFFSTNIIGYPTSNINSRIQPLARFISKQSYKTLNSHSISLQIRPKVGSFFSQSFILQS